MPAARPVSTSRRPVILHPRHLRLKYILPMTSISLSLSLSSFSWSSSFLCLPFSIFHSISNLAWRRPVFSRFLSLPARDVCSYSTFYRNERTTRRWIYSYVITGHRVHELVHTNLMFRSNESLPSTPGGKETSLEEGRRVTIWKRKITEYTYNIMIFVKCSERSTINIQSFPAWLE